MPSFLPRRRDLFRLGAGAFAAATLAAPARAAATGILDAAVDGGLIPDAPVDQSLLFQAALDRAAGADGILFLPPGRYLVGDIALPRRVRLAGVGGASRLVFASGAGLLAGSACELVRLTDIVLDGAARPVRDDAPGLVFLADCPDVAVSGCRIEAGTRAGLAFDRCGGRIDGNDIARCTVGIRAMESTGLSIAGNTVADCADGGILVHRWTPGEDGTLVTANRVERIGAASGGTGQFGNGINVYQAHGVVVSDNRIADCAFTAVRANGSDNIQIVGNNCARLGEVGIYSEFVFLGAVIASNVVDTAATGVSIANFLDGGRMAVVSGNLIRNLTGDGPYGDDTPSFGIGIAVEADAAVTGNVIDKAPLAGLWLGWGPYLRDIAATGNVIRDAGMGVAVSVVEGSGTAMISDNIISGARDGAVIGMRWADRVTADLTLAGTAEFPHLTVERNRT